MVYGYDITIVNGIVKCPDYLGFMGGYIYSFHGDEKNQLINQGLVNIP